MARDEDTCAFLEWWYKKYGDYENSITWQFLLNLEDFSSKEEKFEQWRYNG